MPESLLAWYRKWQGAIFSTPPRQGHPNALADYTSPSTNQTKTKKAWHAELSLAAAEVELGTAARCIVEPRRPITKGKQSIRACALATPVARMPSPPAVGGYAAPVGINPNCSNRATRRTHDK